MTNNASLSTVYSSLVTLDKKVVSNFKSSHRIIKYNSNIWGEKMATATSKRPKSASVKHASLEQTGAFLQALPEKPKEELSLKEAIAQLQVPLRAALAKGYSYQELAALLAEKGINISAFTLKNYVPSGKRSANKEKVAAKTGTRGRTTTTRQTATKEPATKSPRSTAAKTTQGKTSTASASASKPARGRKTTTAATTKAETGATVKQPTAKRTAPKTTRSTSTSKASAKSGVSRRGKKTT
jgi:hypothetical protein